MADLIRERRVADNRIGLLAEARMWAGLAAEMSWVILVALWVKFQPLWRRSER